MKSISIFLLALFSLSTIRVSAIDTNETLGEKILNATSVQEIDNLLNDYHNIDSEPATATTALGISPLSVPSDWMLLSNYSNGGTVYLNNFTGSKGLGYNLYKKIVYLNATETLFLLDAMTDTTVLTILRDHVSGTISGAIATKIATALGVPTVRAAFLIGLPIAFLYGAVASGKAASLKRAITTAGGGKVRYDMYFMIQLLPSKTTYMTEYSPWIGNKIYVPRYYSEVGYKPGVIDMK